MTQFIPRLGYGLPRILFALTGALFSASAWAQQATPGVTIDQAIRLTQQAIAGSAAAPVRLAATKGDPGSPTATATIDGLPCRLRQLRSAGRSV